MSILKTFWIINTTNITNVVRGGASSKIVQALAGHSKITLTMDTRISQNCTELMRHGSIALTYGHLHTRSDQASHSNYQRPF